MLPINTRKILISYLLACLSVAVGCQLAANRQNSIGRKAFETGQIAQAIDRFQRAINLNPQNADAYHNLATSYYQLGKQAGNSQWVAQAEQLYRQAISLNDQHIEAHRGLAALLVENNKEQYAFDLYNHWRNRYPQSSEPLIEIARLYQEYGDHRRATDFLTDAVRLDSRNVRALKALGHVREAQGQWNLALENYQRSLSLDNTQVDVAQRIQDISTRLAQLPGQQSVR